MCWCGVGDIGVISVGLNFLDPHQASLLILASSPQSLPVGLWDQLYVMSLSLLARSDASFLMFS